MSRDLLYQQNFSKLNISDNNLRGTVASWCDELKHIKSLHWLDLSECELTELDKEYINESLADLRENGLDLLLD